MTRQSRKKSQPPGHRRSVSIAYDDILSSIVELLEEARRTSARTVNTIMTVAYWEIGRRIVECEQAGAARAEYGSNLLPRLSADLTSRFGRGFSPDNLGTMRRFYLTYSTDRISETPSRKSPFAGPGQTPTEFAVESLANTNLLTPAEKSLPKPPVPSFPLPWSHYVRLLKVEKPEARKFYETEALRGGWSVRQLDRQVSTLFYERTLASRNKGAMLKAGLVPRAGEPLTPAEEIKDPLVLEFLGLKDEYSETDLEEALIRQLEAFLLELGGDFAFVGRQKRLRIGDEWYRVDLVFFHRLLRCLVVIDLKVGRFTHSDAGQMLLYLGYAAEHWVRPGENPPVGLVLCAQHNHAVAHYTLDRLPNKVLTTEYRMTLPDEKTLAAELERTQAAFKHRPPSKRSETKRKGKESRS